MAGAYLATRIAPKTVEGRRRKRASEVKRSASLTIESIRDLPPNTACPAEGVAFGEKLSPEMEPKYWIFLGTHWMNLDFYNKTMVDDPKHYKHVAYPARVRKEAGFVRAWGTKSSGGE